MSLFGLLDLVKEVVSPDSSPPVSYLIKYGGQKKDGSHDHRGNCGEDRTPSQKDGDASRRK